MRLVNPAWISALTFVLGAGAGCPPEPVSERHRCATVRRLITDMEFARLDKEPVILQPCVESFCGWVDLGVRAQRQGAVLSVVLDKWPDANASAPYRHPPVLHDDVIAIPTDDELLLYDGRTRSLSRHPLIGPPRELRRLGLERFEDGIYLVEGLRYPPVMDVLRPGSRALGTGDLFIGVDGESFARFRYTSSGVEVRFHDGTSARLDFAGEIRPLLARAGVAFFRTRDGSGRSVVEVRPTTAPRFVRLGGNFAITSSGMLDLSYEFGVSRYVDGKSVAWLGSATHTFDGAPFPKGARRTRVKHVTGVDVTWILEELQLATCEIRTRVVEHRAGSAATTLTVWPGLVHLPTSDGQKLYGVLGKVDLVPLPDELTLAP